MTIQPIQQGENKFCGPAVISSIAGITTDEAEKLIQKVRGNDKPVVGTWNWEIEQVFESLGWKVTTIKGRGSIFMTMMVLNDPGTYIFYVPSHVIAIEITDDGKRFIIDNHTKTPLRLSNSARLGQRVQLILRLEK